jgi:polysaccharide pyruvyl transferase CsaB
LKNVNILISGWYGNANLGDEAILYAIKESIRSEICNSNVCALTFNPSYTKKYQQIDAVDQLPSGIRSWVKSILKGTLFKTISAFMRCDVFILGGGGFLSDWQPEAPWFWLRQVLLAKIFGKKIMIYGIGAGPFIRNYGKWLTRNVLNICVNAITVRDDISKECLMQIGVNPSDVSVTGDPVISLKLNAASKTRIVNKKIIIAICVAPFFYSTRLWPGMEHKLDRYKTSISEFVIKLDPDKYDVKFIPMQENVDTPFVKSIFSKITYKLKVEKQPDDILQAIDMLSDAKIIIAMRCHAAILGAIQGIPIIGIVYHHKVAEFLKTLDILKYAEEIGDGINWPDTDINSERLFNTVETIISNYSMVKCDMEAKLTEAKLREKENIIKLKSLLDLKL